MFRGARRIRPLLLVPAVRAFTPAPVPVERYNVAKEGAVVLYGYGPCPFSNKVRAFLDFYKIPYVRVEVNPLFKREVSFSSYRKTPIAFVGGKQVNGSGNIIESVLGRLGAKENEEEEDVRKWKSWVDDDFVHVLSPNIYRTPKESLESFSYISNVSNFGAVEGALAQYVGAVLMFGIGKRLKSKHGYDDVRQALYDRVNLWAEQVGDSFLGGRNSPTEADLAVFGVLRAIEGLETFRDMMQHTKIKPWYERMTQQVGESSCIHVVGHSERN